jgi:alkylation response protein AidB-like acyl-CoA dehydrogenase
LKALRAIVMSSNPTPTIAAIEFLRLQDRRVVGGDPLVLNLEFSEDQKLLRDSFARFFKEESSIARVRAAEPLGFDPALQNSLAEMGALSMRVPEAAGGGGFGLMDAALVSEEAGRQLVSAPLFETIIATRLLAELDGADAGPWLEAAMSGEKIVTLALHEVRPGVAQIVPGGAVADAVLTLEGDKVSLVAMSRRNQAQPNHGAQPIASLALSGEGAVGEPIAIASGPVARDAFLAGLEEWKLLTAAGLNGLSRRALEQAADYARERIQFEKPIGAYQAVSHPLADRAVDVDASQLFTWWAISQVAAKAPDAAAAVAMAYWWAAKTASETTNRALHTHGGYGLTLEYDLQLYFRRAKAWPLVLGDPEAQLALAGARLWLDQTPTPLPEAGEVGLDFEFGEEADALVKETRELLDRITTPEWRANSHWTFDGYDPEVNRKIGEAGLVHPSWPKEWGGRGAHPFAAAASLAVWPEYNVTRHPQSTSHFVGSTLMHCASEELKAKVLPDLGKGLKNSSLGYSEPASGSDIFAAKTRAVWDDKAQEWVINGQKMFTSGANINDYIFLLTRTDPDAPKHMGITLFLVPTTTPGIEIRPIFTVGGERTNATFYTDVRLPDLYRVGEVNGGLKVLANALVLEHGSGYHHGDHDMVDIAVEWARQPGADGRPRIEDASIRNRIARVKAHAYMTELIAKRAMFHGVTNPARRTAFGPMSKLFGSETKQRDLGDLMDLTAPDSLFRSREKLGQIEEHHRGSQGGTIYGGTSEVHRSMIAEVGLGLPRTR